MGYLPECQSCPGAWRGETGAGWRGTHPHESPFLTCLQWDLVCEQRGLNKITSTCFFVGVLLGAVVYGHLADRLDRHKINKGPGRGGSLPMGSDLATALCRFGRRQLLLVAYVSSLVLALASAASVNYIMFVITRTLTGSALAGFTIIVLPLGENKHGKACRTGGRLIELDEPIWPLLTVFLSPMAPWLRV